ncbi:MBL fold metallo-hydrolase RNA specificity domain-containing protein [Pseudomonas solani]|uniref:MBL fold metallo-hydrolase RNA specificity domain-containing protein n=1 Tax=Pseudomonas solani TaxID=2731552 RepID=UPI003D6B259F
MCSTLAVRQVTRLRGRSSVLTLVVEEQRYDIWAQVHIIGGYSAHADQSGLVRFVTRMSAWPKFIWCMVASWLGMLWLMHCENAMLVRAVMWTSSVGC